MKLQHLAFGFALCATPSLANVLDGPARFCGYSPVIDLLAGEKVTALEGGVHAGRFRWEGAFGVLEVFGVGWASRPKGRIVRPSTRSSPARFAQQRKDDGYQVAIWNRSKGAAYFTAQEPFTPQQLAAIDRVQLFDEGQSPAGCTLRTVFVWK